MTQPDNQGVLRRWRKFLPVTARTPVVTLGEGATPLLPAPRLARKLGLPETSLHLKFEGMNPTGSFKDRGMTVAVSKALEEGAGGLLCASTGNTAASAAAYAAAAGMRCVVLLPKGGVAAGKLTQALMHGARVVAVAGSFDHALRLALDAAAEARLTVVNSVNPHRIEGQKTAAFEVVESLGRAPDYQFMPVGNAGNITAYWKGYKEWAGLGSGAVRIARRASGRAMGGSRSGRGAELPAMMGFQAAGADPLVRGRPVARPRTVASAIRIGNPASWEAAIRARDESGGMIGRVTDREILSAWSRLAELEGVFCEPSSAAGVAGLARLCREGFFRRGRPAAGLRIVCVLTGHGLKDPDTPLTLGRSWKTVPPDKAALLSLLRSERCRAAHR